MSSPLPYQIPGYEMIRPLGEGGMATVYLAVQKSLDRKVAIKILRTASDDDPERTERRFLREGRILAKITHRSVCGIYDIAKVGDIAYIAMEFLDGGTLVDRMLTGISVGESISIVVQVASALQEAHNQGIVHRDLKPANVMMRGGKIPVLTDFGIARELTSNQTKITVENMIVGTPVYMSPEQVTGGEIDGRSDVYSLGIMFFELLTGTTPYKGDNPIQVCMQHLTAPLPVLPEELAELQPVLDRALAKKRDERYATMTEFTHALRDLFVQSVALRTRAALAPNQPWTEQLRQMGFSFDTLRDADLNVKLRAQQASLAQEPARAEPVVERTPERSADPAPRAQRAGLPWPWIGVALAGLLALIAGGTWFMRDQGPSEKEQVVLKSSARDFDDHMGRDELFEPPSGNAASVLRDMRTLGREHVLTVGREKQLLKAIRGRVLALTEKGQLDAAQKLLEQAGGLFEVEQLAEAQAALGSGRDRLAKAATADATLRRAEQALSKAGAESELAGMLGALRGALGNDPRVAQVELKAEVYFAGRIEAELAGDRLAQAQVVLTEWQRALPKSARTARYQSDLDAKQAKRSFKDRVGSVRAYLYVEGFGAAAMQSAVEALRTLKTASPGAPELRAVEQEIIGKAQSSVQAALAQKQPGQARALLTALGPELAAAASLRTLSAQVSKAEDAERMAALMGFLVVDAQPWGKVAGIFDSASKAIPVPAGATTPFKLGLVEGAYRIDLVDAAGQRKSINANVSRGQLAKANAVFDVKTDEFLREAGY